MDTLQSNPQQAEIETSRNESIIYDPGLHISIPFVCGFQSKIAALILTHNYPIYMISLFSEVLLGDIVAHRQITATDYDAVYGRVAEYRYNLALVRESTRRPWQ